jgi:hypothetical protein
MKRCFLELNIVPITYSIVTECCYDSVIILNVLMLNVANNRFKLSAVMLSVIMLSVIMLNVMAPISVAVYA